MDGAPDDNLGRVQPLTPRGLRQSMPRPAYVAPGWLEFSSTNEALGGGGAVLVNEPVVLGQLKQARWLLNTYSQHCNQSFLF